MDSFCIDIPVLIIFFCRSEQLSSVFEQVKKARPSKLYLYQDGAREGNADDASGIERCRTIVSDDKINWECEVHRLYQEKNYGCDPSEFIAQKWMFETEEMGIVLEDDDVPSQSFFPYCKELLEKYKDDTRINMICGMNNNGVSEYLDASYLFTRRGSIWGWASWKRVIDTWDGKYTWLDDHTLRERVRHAMTTADYDAFIKTAERHRATGREHYESINAAGVFLYERYNIVPKYNMICNIGIAAESTHSVNDIRLLPKRTQRILNMKTYEIEFPLVHPKTVEIDWKYENSYKITTIERIGMTFESAYRSIRYQGLSSFVKRIKKKIAKK